MAACVVPQYVVNLLLSEFDLIVKTVELITDNNPLLMPHVCFSQKLVFLYSLFN